MYVDAECNFLNQKFIKSNVLQDLVMRPLLK